MKIALAHEYFSARGGAEAVAHVFHEMWPDAPVYTFFHDRARYGPLDGWRIVTSSLQSFPIGGGRHRLLLPLYPSAARRLRVSDDVNVVLVSTSAFIKGLALGDDTAEVAYCHSPTRYLWDWSEEYLREEVPAVLHAPVRELLARLRETDLEMARRVDRWIANSPVVARRAGGAREIVRDGIDGVLFDAPDPALVEAAVQRAESTRWDPRALKQSARRFDLPRFQERIRELVNDAARVGRAIA